MGLLGTLDGPLHKSPCMSLLLIWTLFFFLALTSEVVPAVPDRPR